MGPLRRGLILLFLPSPAWAEICAELRPDWDGAPVTAMTEAMNLFMTLPAIALLAATMIALRFGAKWLVGGVVLLWTFLVSMMALPSMNGPRAAGMVEGCVGSPAVFILVVTVLCAGLVLFTTPKTNRSNE